MHDVVTQDSITMKDLGTLLGKLGAYMDIMQGRWERAFLLANWRPESKHSLATVPVTPGMRSQARWWDRRIITAMARPARIPDSRRLSPATSVHVFTDSAGGLGRPGSGFGAAIWTWPRSYVAYYWPEAIRKNIPVEGVKLSNKLMFLEAIAVLASVVAAPDKVRGKHITVHCDNAAAVFGYARGHSKELLAYSVLKGAVDVAAGLGASLSVNKIRRVSCVGALVADLMSKGDMPQALAYMEYADPAPGFLSRTLLKWIEHPTPTRVLGQAMLLELRAAGVPVMISFMVDEEVERLVVHS